MRAHRSHRDLRGQSRGFHGLAVLCGLLVSNLTSCATETIGLTQTDDGSLSVRPQNSSPAETSATSGPVASDDPLIIPAAPEDAGSDDGRCTKIDLLFIVDNSESMREEQDSLIRSFPAFIDVVQGVLGNSDYQIMVVDTDATGPFFFASLGDALSGNATCDPAPSCCGDVCVLASIPFVEAFVSSCNGTSCTELSQSDSDPNSDSCEGVLGAGRRLSVDGEACGIAESRRYMLPGQPNLAETFSCAARVGTAGDGDEQPIGALLSALSPFHNAPDGCNAGFLRDDAVLVATIITDEEDSDSPGHPPEWRQAVLDAKGGNEDAVVVLGLIEEPSAQDGPSCARAETAPRLRQFIESFRFGSLGSVCSPDYTPFFEAAVTGIETSCSEFRDVAR